ncbi:transposase [Bradyrhizobium yuanmingense]|uniref:IS66 family insertion sequence element accessory protein TnpB n=1 Tax=Bradyrhizobium yuanmingense TaxID=108015 RepID=UPI003515BB7F
MFRLASDLRVYLHRAPIDFRAGINSPAIVLEQSMGLDPFQRAVFAFCNRRRDRVKLLIYDRSGFWMLLKRLEADRFHWPRSQEAVLTLTTEELHWLLDGSTSRRCGAIRCGIIRAWADSVRCARRHRRDRMTPTTTWNPVDATA